MKSRALTVVVFLIGLILLDRAIGFAMRAAYDGTTTGEAGGQINAALRNGDREIIVFGSSLARHQVDPKILHDELSRSALNAGCNGQGIYYARMLEALLLQSNCKSQHFVYVVDWRDLINDDLDRARMFAVFAEDSPTVRAILASSIEHRLKLHSHAYRFNTLAVSTARQLLAPDQEGHDGFVGIAIDYEPTAKDFADMDRDLAEGLSETDVELMHGKISLYGEFTQAAEEQGIQVTFVVAPTYRNGRQIGSGEQFVLDELERLAVSQRADFIRLDETTVSEFQDVRNFGDPRHLNATGAELFTRLIAKHLSNSN